MWTQCTQWLVPGLHALGWASGRGGGKVTTKAFIHFLLPGPVNGEAGWAPGTLHLNDPPSSPHPVPHYPHSLFALVLVHSGGGDIQGVSGRLCAGLRLGSNEGNGGGRAPSVGRLLGLDGLARPAGLSHMRLELERQTPGLEHERARSGGPGQLGEGVLNLTFLHLVPTSA